MELTAVKHVDTVLTTLNVSMRTVPVNKGVLLVTRHTSVIQVSDIRILAANFNLWYRPWDVLLHLQNKPLRSMQETKRIVHKTNRTVQKRTMIIYERPKNDQRSVLYHAISAQLPHTAYMTTVARLRRTKNVADEISSKFILKKVKNRIR